MKNKNMLVMPMLLILSLLFLTGCPSPADGPGGVGNGGEVDANTVKTPVASPVESDNDFSNTPVNVTITTETEGATIYFTVDGSDPVVGNDGTIEYKEDKLYYLELYGPKIIKAIAVKDGMTDSAIMKKPYNRTKWSSINTPKADEKVSLMGDGKKFSWDEPSTSNGETFKYDLYISKTQENMTLYKGDLTEKEINVKDLDGGTTYYWKVIAKASFGYMYESVVRTFTTKQFVKGSWVSIADHGFAKVTDDSSYSISSFTNDGKLYVLERRIDKDSKKHNKLKYFNGTSWTEVYSASDDKKIVGFNFDNNNVPYVLTKESILSGDPIQLYKIVSGSLTKVGSDYSYYTTISSGDLGLFFDTTNKAIIRFENSGPNLRKQNSEGNWDSIGTSNIDEKMNERFTIIGDTLYVVYVDDNNKTSVKKNTSGNVWDFVGNETFVDDDAKGNILLKDSKGDLTVVLQENSALTAYKLVNNVWTKQGEQVNFVTVIGAKIDSADGIYAQYTDLNTDTTPNTYDNYTAKYVAGEWAILGNAKIDGFSGETHYKAQLQLANDVPYTVFNKDGVVTIKKFNKE